MTTRTLTGEGARKGDMLQSNCSVFANELQINFHSNAHRCNSVDVYCLFYRPSIYLDDTFVLGNCFEFFVQLPCITWFKWKQIKAERAAADRHSFAMLHLQTLSSPPYNHYSLSLSRSFRLAPSFSPCNNSTNKNRHDSSERLIVLRAFYVLNMYCVRSIYGLRC